MIVNDVMQVADGYFRQISGLVVMLVDMHLDIAQREASWEQRRLTSGLIVLSVGIGLFGMGTVMLQVAGVWLAHYLGFAWPWAVVVVAGCNFFVGTLCLYASMRRLRGPFMAETWRRLSKTTAAFVQNYGS